MDPKRLDLVYHVLDLQLLDVDGRRCGKVDDIEFDDDLGRATALLVGPGLYPRRLPGRFLNRLGRRIFGKEVIGDNVIRVPWEEIAEISATVQLKGKADEMKLGRGDTVLAPIMSKLLLVPERRK